jgi:hypothetical protein
MLYDALLPNVLAVIAVALFVTGAVLLARIPNRHLPIRTQKHARDFVRVYVTIEVGVGFLIASMWVDGTNWLPGRIFATVAYVALLVGLLPVLRGIVRVATERESAARTAAE